MSKESAGASGSISYTAENKFHRKHMSARVAALTSGLAGATDLSVKSITLNFNKNVVRDNTLRTAAPEDILNQSMTIDGEIVLNYEDQTFKNYMLDGTKRALRVRVTNTDNTIGAGSTNPYLEFQFDAVDFFDWEPDRSLDDITTQTINFRANYDLTNSIQSQPVLENVVSAY